VVNRFNEFMAGYKPTQLDEVRKVQTVGTDFSELLRKYEWVLVRNDSLPCGSQISEVLTPDEINSFLQGTKQYEDHRNYSWRNGLIMSILIQNSYNNGYNHFLLNTEALYKTNNFGFGIIGRKENPLFMSIEGEIWSKLGFGAKNCLFILNGGAGAQCGEKARFSEFRIEDFADLGCGWNAEDCTFKTPVWANIEQMRKNIPKSNTLIYFENGKEVIIK